MPRFVVLTHDHPFLHWDFMLEAGDTLRTWRLHDSPESQRGILADALPHHRLHYLSYEGPVSRGRGEVRRWDWGEYVSVTDEPSCVEVTLSGQRLRGRATLELEKQGESWTFTFSDDRPALPGSQSSRPR